MVDVLAVAADNFRSVSCSVFDRIMDGALKISHIDSALRSEEESVTAE